MAIVKRDAHGVTPHGLDLQNLDVFGDRTFVQKFFTGMFIYTERTRAGKSQTVGRKHRPGSVIPVKTQISLWGPKNLLRLNH